MTEPIGDLLKPVGKALGLVPEKPPAPPEPKVAPVPDDQTSRRNQERQRQRRAGDQQTRLSTFLTNKSNQLG